MFTKKHYALLAKILKESRPDFFRLPATRQTATQRALWNSIVSSFVEEFKVDNARFDEDKFRDALI